jgi:hypothetical protein
VSERLPVVSGAQLIAAVGKLGWAAALSAGATSGSSIQAGRCRWWCRFTASSSVDREELRRIL